MGEEKKRKKREGNPNGGRGGVVCCSCLIAEVTESWNQKKRPPLTGMEHEFPQGKPKIEKKTSGLLFPASVFPKEEEKEKKGKGNLKRKDQREKLPRRGKKKEGDREGVKKRISLSCKNIRAI